MSFVLLLTSCTRPPTEPEKVFEQIHSGKAQLDEIKKYDYETQWAIYELGMYREPPMLQLAEPLASEGKPMFEFLINKLSKSQEELDFIHAILIIDDMQHSKSYNVCSDVDDLITLKRFSIKIKDAGWRKSYEESIIDLCQ